MRRYLEFMIIIVVVTTISESGRIPHRGPCTVRVESRIPHRGPCTVRVESRIPHIAPCTLLLKTIVPHEAPYITAPPKTKIPDEAPYVTEHPTTKIPDAAPPTPPPNSIVYQGEPFIYKHPKKKWTVWEFVDACRKKGEEFTFYANAVECQPSCNYPKGKKTGRCFIKPGCVCPKYFVRRDWDQKCIPRSQCPYTTLPKWPNRNHERYSYRIKCLPFYGKWCFYTH